jgi:hypothetical protein
MGSATGTAEMMTARMGRMIAETLVSFLTMMASMSMTMTNTREAMM